MYLFGALVQNSLVSLHVKTIWFDTCCLHILGSSLRLFHQVAVHSLVDASYSGELTAWQAKLRTRTFFLTLVPQIVLVVPITTRFFHTRYLTCAKFLANVTGCLQGFSVAMVSSLSPPWSPSTRQIR